jgi:hypothetical protein
MDTDLPASHFQQPVVISVKSWEGSFWNGSHRVDLMAQNG